MHEKHDPEMGATKQHLQEAAQRIRAARESELQCDRGNSVRQSSSSSVIQRSKSFTRLLTGVRCAVTVETANAVRRPLALR